VAPVNELWVIYGFVFVAAILGIESLYWLFIGTRGAKKAVNRRLALSERNAAKSEIFDILRHERGVSDSSSFAGLNDFLVQTGMRLSKFGLALSTVLTGVAITAVLSVLSINMWIAAIIGLTTGPALVGLYLIRARSKRVGSFARQLPDGPGRRRARPADRAPVHDRDRACRARDARSDRHRIRDDH
jgi:Flp pilus assembly protein TadB